MKKPALGAIAALPKPAPRADIIACLESLLARAQNGELHGFAFILTTTTEGWVEYGSRGAIGSQLLGGMELLKHRTLRTIEEKDD